MDKQRDETMAFRTLTHCSNPMKLASDNSLSTHSLQPKAVPDPNSKWMGMGSEMPWRMARSRIEEANRAQETSGFRRQGRATRDLAAATRSHQELLGSEGGLRTMD